MTDKEAYELMLKYGGEISISKAKEMIHLVGIEKATENIEWAYRKQKSEPMPNEFTDWIKQGLRYISEQLNPQN
jgi:hypothetical protein